MDFQFLNQTREWSIFCIDLGILWILILEYQYDYQKDEAKKQKKTRTSKKVTTEPSGIHITEETTETTEPANESK